MASGDSHESEEIRANLGIAVAAVPSEIAHEGAHPAEIGAVHHPPPVALRSHEARRVKRSEVKRQTGRRYTQRIGDLARRAACRVRSEEKAEGPQTMGVGEGAQASNRSFLMHNSILVE